MLPVVSFYADGGDAAYGNEVHVPRPFEIAGYNESPVVRSPPPPIRMHLGVGFAERSSPHFVATMAMLALSTRDGRPSDK